MQSTASKNQFVDTCSNYLRTWSEDFTLAKAIELCNHSSAVINDPSLSRTLASLSVQQLDKNNIK